MRPGSGITGEREPVLAAAPFLPDISAPYAHAHSRAGNEHHRNRGKPWLLQVGSTFGGCFQSPWRFVRPCERWGFRGPCFLSLSLPSFFRSSDIRYHLFRPCNWGCSSNSLGSPVPPPRFGDGDSLISRSLGLLCSLRSRWLSSEGTWPIASLEAGYWS